MAFDFEAFKKLLEESLVPLNESAASNAIIQAIDGHYQVLITYVTPDNVAVKRQIEIYAYGLSKAGNEVIRAFQIDSGKNRQHRSESGVWKLFRVDRIKSFRILKTMFKPFSDEPRKRGFLYAPWFNSESDRSMTTIYKMSDLANYDGETYDNHGSYFKRDADRKRDKYYQKKAEKQQQKAQEPTNSYSQYDSSIEKDENPSTDVMKGPIPNPSNTPAQQPQQEEPQEFDTTEFNKRLNNAVNGVEEKEEDDKEKEQTA